MLPPRFSSPSAGHEQSKSDGSQVSSVLVFDSNYEPAAAWVSYSVLDDCLTDAQMPIASWSYFQQHHQYRHYILGPRRRSWCPVPRRQLWQANLTGMFPIRGVASV